MRADLLDEQVDCFGESVRCAAGWCGRRGSHSTSGRRCERGGSARRRWPRRRVGRTRSGDAWRGPSRWRRRPPRAARGRARQRRSHHRRTGGQAGAKLVPALRVEVAPRHQQQFGGCRRAGRLCAAVACCGLLDAAADIVDGLGGETDGVEVIDHQRSPCRAGHLKYRALR